MNEQWRAVIGFEGFYEVSDHGHVRRLPRMVRTKGGGTRLHKGGLIGGKPNKRTGYIEVHLCREGKITRTTTHVVVCEAFNGPRPSSNHEAAHNDGSCTNNVPGNLRWATPKENAADRKLHGTERVGEQSLLSKLTEDDVRTIRALRSQGDRPTSLARRYGVTYQAIWLITERKNWKHVA